MTLSSIFGLKAKKKIFFDEVRHNFVSLRFLASKKSKVKESVAIVSEAENAYKERVKFMTVMATKGEPFFRKGTEKFSNYRKLKMLFGLISSSGTKLSDLFGRRGAKFLSRGDAMVQGTEKYFFDQFKNSPYIRYPNLALYQVSTKILILILKNF